MRPYGRSEQLRYPAKHSRAISIYGQREGKGRAGRVAPWLLRDVSLDEIQGECSEVILEGVPEKRQTGIGVLRAGHTFC